MMKKSLLALAVAALSVNAFAVDLDNTTTPGTQVFAKEISLASTPDIGSTKITATVKAGFALNSGFIRFDLDNGATFKANPTLTVASLTTPDVTVASGGAGQNYVIFKVADASSTPTGITSTAVVTLTSGGSGITVANKNAVGVTYALYETAGNAAQKTGALNTKSGVLLSFATALNVSATANANKLKIDAIGSASKKFALAAGGSTDTNVLVDLSVALATPVPLKADGSNSVALTDVVKDTQWKVSGNFSAVKASGLTATDAATIATDKQSVTLAKTNGVTTSQSLQYVVTGADEIAETTLAATFTPVAQTGFEVSATTLDNITKLEKNGTTKAVDLAMKPGGFYKNFIRITNKDTISGLFFIKVINDEGNSVSFPLSDVAGQSASIAAGASTTQISIQSIFDAASTKGLNLTGEGKLRLEVTGQTNDLTVSNYVVSTDGNSLSKF